MLEFLKETGKMLNWPARQLGNWYYGTEDITNGTLIEPVLNGLNSSAVTTEITPYVNETCVASDFINWSKNTGFSLENNPASSDSYLSKTAETLSPYLGPVGKTFAVATPLYFTWRKCRSYLNTRESEKALEQKVTNRALLAGIQERAKKGELGLKNYVLGLDEAALKVLNGFEENAVKVLLGFKETEIKRMKDYKDKTQAQILTDFANHKKVKSASANPEKVTVKN